jgi:hypothetical protein
MVPLGVYNENQKARDREAAQLEREHERDMVGVKEEITKVWTEIDKIRDKSWVTVGRVSGLAAAAAAILTLVIYAYVTLKGAK